ncbi:hypothetical protein GPECTOR_14g12 [Gonium pectorale]|uniref:Uncharacterized protein n=1 Tax=Gonium pectorale TaxID=33097 RepID=A0A150GLY8_GONPE|nr:hypothetical protein GPECTOR_14g12 [Gonium pectorale]|eukprot:KXZ50869.1 hypothetical protein GPECTOR_14g12 [Gonium pectorale]
MQPYVSELVLQQVLAFLREQRMHACAAELLRPQRLPGHQGQQGGADLGSPDWGALPEAAGPLPQKWRGRADASGHASARGSAADQAAGEVVPAADKAQDGPLSPLPSKADTAIPPSSVIGAGAAGAAAAAGALPTALSPCSVLFGFTDRALETRYLAWRAASVASSDRAAFSAVALLTGVMAASLLAHREPAVGSKLRSFALFLGADVVPCLLVSQLGLAALYLHRPIVNMAKAALRAGAGQRWGLGVQSAAASVPQPGVHVVQVGQERSASGRGARVIALAGAEAEAYADSSALAVSGHSPQVAPAAMTSGAAAGSSNAPRLQGDGAMCKATGPPQAEAGGDASPAVTPAAVALVAWARELAAVSLSPLLLAEVAARYWRRPMPIAVLLRPLAAAVFVAHRSLFPVTVMQLRPVAAVCAAALQ